MNQRFIPHLDVLLAGGGISGLWLTNLLHSRGYRVALLERGTLGCAQTLACQGMIHGGLKYALGGSLTAASEAIAGMPDRWRRCIEGRDDVNLRGLETLAENNLLFANGSGLGRLATFFASRMLRGRIHRLPESQWPPSLRGCNGWVYALNDLVLSMPHLLAQLLRPISDLVHQQALRAEQLERVDQGWQLNLGEQTITAGRLILTAGTGNAELLSGLGYKQPVMQRRRLQQVIVRHGSLQPLYGHCLTGISSTDFAQPRLTISSHPDGSGWLWYLGGRLANQGAAMPADELIQLARTELKICLPWLDLQDAELDTLSIDRAEAAQDGERPDQAFVEQRDNCIVCWPTKLSLAPDLGDRVSALLPPPGTQPQPKLPLPAARIGSASWERSHAS